MTIYKSIPRDYPWSEEDIDIEYEVDTLTIVTDDQTRFRQSVRLSYNEMDKLVKQYFEGRKLANEEKVEEERG